MMESRRTMMESVRVSTPSVFLSFSSDDTLLARKLMLALRRNGVHVWDYTHDDEAIKAGQPIPEALRSQIDSAGLVVALLTKASTRCESVWTHREVSYAIEATKQIVPIVTCGLSRGDWTGAYETLAQQQRRWLELRPGDAKSLEECCSAILATLDVRYRPFVEPHVRLPVLDRFDQELDALGASVSNANYLALALVLQQFAERFGRDYRSAYDAMKQFLALARGRLPGVTLYYPYVVTAVCALQLDRLDEAEDYLTVAIENQLVDEDAHAALGHVYYRRAERVGIVRDEEAAKQRFAKASEAFRRALAICQAQGRPDLELQLNTISALLKAGASQDEVRQSLRWQEGRPGEPMLEERSILLEATLHLQSGVPAEAVAVLESAAPVEGGDRLPWLSTYARALELTGRLRDALKLLEQADLAEPRDVRSDSTAKLLVTLWHDIARMRTEVDSPQRAIQVYRDVLCQQECATRQYLMEFAGLLRAIGQEHRARDLRASVVSAELFGAPSTSSDFYYVGLAHYVEGRHEAARALFDLSDRREYYDSL